MKQRIFISGTDTDVGKTVLSLLMIRALMLQQQSCVYLKPIQTGCIDPDQESDPATIARVLPNGLPLGMKPADCIGLCCPVPKAPLFSKCPVQARCDIATLVDFVSGHEQVDYQIIEGAGGLFVPINWRENMIDLAGALQAEVLLAARAGLGTINHTLLSLEALHRRNISCMGVVFLDPTGTVPDDDIRENIQAIGHFASVKAIVSIGHIPDLRQPPEATLDQLAQLSISAR